MERDSKKDMMVTLAVLLVVVIIVVGAVIVKKKSTDGANAANNAVTSAKDTVQPAVDAPGTVNPNNASSSSFKDGTYSAMGTYSTPDGPETITVKVTLKDGAVSDTSATASMQSRESKEYVAQFLDAYKTFVVGKDVSSLKLSRVSGSSLTSQGFNSAIQQIQTQAQS